jgi:hypothetical protein
MVRRAAYGIVMLCAVGGALVAFRHDWQDAALIGLFGMGALVTARKMAWEGRQEYDFQTTHVWAPTPSAANAAESAAD